ncbi:hypothetical protein FRC18_011100 [Serendipita sp. 400]|nr:hypothetical protein FRC18_011100 [Serendipita sp. 400]
MSRAPSRGQHQVEDLDSININMLDSPEVFDFPGLSAQLFEIAQAAHLPSEYMVHIVQIAELGQWKQMQDDNGVLSYRELARRGQAIERIVSGPNPRVPELHGAAQQILSRLQAIPANQRPVSLIFPLCIAGILGDNAETQRVQAQISSLGASPDLAQAVNRLIAHIRQARWAHELNTSNPLMS